MASIASLANESMTSVPELYGGRVEEYRHSPDYRSDVYAVNDASEGQCREHLIERDVGIRMG
jgi:hypothetical protein